MVKGNIRNEVNLSEIMDFTHGGYSIIRHYHGSVPKICKSPFRRDDRESFGFFFKSGVVLWKDASTGEDGNAIHYVQKRFGLTFKEALDKVAWDFGIGGKIINVSPVQITWNKPEEDREHVHISCIPMSFTQKHKDYWEKAGVTEEMCNSMNCFAAKSVSIKRKRAYIAPNEIVFYYYSPEEDAYKVYFPEREKQNRFRNNVPGSHIWYLDRIEECENLLICKSNKDAITLSQFGLCVCATQNEGISCLSPNKEIIDGKAKNKWVVFGNDKQGWEESYKITKKFGWKHFNIPQGELEKGINDPYLYAATYGKDALGKLLKEKGLI